MKNTRIISAACILASLILLAGCQKGLGDFGGQSVRFGATTKGSTTKAAYSGEGTFSNGFLTWERIEWESTDRIRVASNYAYCKDHGAGSSTPLNSHYADYTLSGINTPTDDPKISKATMAPLNTTSNGLVWDDAHESGYAFYAVSPCPLDNTNISLGSGDEGNGTLGAVTATLPSDQTFAQTAKTRYVAANGAVADAEGKVFTAAQEGGYTYNVYAPSKDIMFLTAAKTGVASGTQGIPLEFKPAFTAFEFHITTTADDLTLTSFGLTATGADDYLSGEYTLTAGTQSGTAVVPSADADKKANKTVSMSFGEGLTIGEGTGEETTNGAAFSLLTLPKANEGIINAFLTTSDGSKATLPLTYATTTEAHAKGAPVKFEAGKKYRVNLMKVGGGWSIKVILDLEDEHLPWTYIETDPEQSKDYPEASQFTIVGAANVRDKYDPSQREDKVWKKYRQYWDVVVADGTPKPITIDYQIMSPVGGTWSVELAGRGASAFTLSGNGTGDSGLSGTVDAEGDNTTKIRLTLTPSSSASGIQVAYIKTYVTGTDGTKYSLDSETQLYDLRGYHYFVLGAT
ncbi:MAG: hypothetical protein II770_00925, partial [Bacteroidales bacterium]|nr:hypothetical protein [Bacteroidales bacterium]